MSSDPAFLFYPGDYLRDTQCLSERVQVAYDRIMCEHMRNICISQSQLNFFTKRLTDDEKCELEMVLTKINECYQITWVAESINKRKAYSESRRKNRNSKSNLNQEKICQTYDLHMENENEIVIENKNKGKIKKPSLEEVKEFFKQNGFSETAADIAYKFYNDGDWHDSRGNKVRNWKQKMRSVWFKDENKVQVKKQLVTEQNPELNEW